MLAKRLTPILNVSTSNRVSLVREARVEEGLGLGQSADVWGRLFRRVRDLPVPERPGWSRQGRWQDDVGPSGEETARQGVWMSIWVEDVDAVHRHCLEQGLEVTWPPTTCRGRFARCTCGTPTGTSVRISRGIEDAE